ncbi:MAG: trigger factor [Solirubrobacteraceae bacterium]|jgi:trigger factor|nr:trigger factor [Solirubrobacteraceae bacterium]
MAVKTNVTELPESRVRVEAEVPAEEVERRVEQTARALGRQLKIPGFRKGKVPPPVVVRRIGRDAVLDEAVRGSLGTWYVDAIDAAGIEPVGDPDLDLGDLPGEGQPLTFSIEIGVRPEAKLGDYRDLEVARREPAVDDAAIDEQVEELRERLARLETAEDHAAAPGDFAVVDFTGTVDGEPVEGAEARDEMVEVGAGRLPDELDAALAGMKAGDEKTVDVAFGDDHRAEQLRGKTASFAVTVKEVKRKELPELNDEFAGDAAGFDSLDELRADVRSKLEEAETRAIDEEFREAALDAAVANATVDVPDALIEARARELWEQLSATLARQGISQEAYLRISGKTEEDLVQDAKPDADRALRREAVLAAVVEAEGIEPSEEEMLEALAHSAEHESTTPEKLLARLREGGRLDTLRRDLASRNAVDLLAETAKPIDPGRAEAREKLWTPGD